MRARAVDGCLMCTLLEHRAQIIQETDDFVSLVPRYALREGHALVSVRSHCTRWSALPRATWLAVCEEAHRLAQRLEPPTGRCYVASLGTAEASVPMSSDHLHLHVLPLPDAHGKPSTVLTWSNGVFELDDDEIDAWVSRLR